MDPIIASSQFAYRPPFDDVGPRKNELSGFTILQISSGMAYRFRLRGNNVRHSWEKECWADSALLHAQQVAREYANDDLYNGWLFALWTTQAMRSLSFS